ncbi:MULTISPECIES: hypothetical protein [Legionella]|uniref:Uncharacterized protein n=1 Tax=Legionella drozanskii LLAP-1 TaxID=1212489 RepID=A0A0W0SWF6_9GAMM|nr:MULTISPECIES: hypothetical protein [Legionella]KTC87698.1 hypothetical protein Ldro_1317 [Legionella drozanskii LLAP-1]PJE16232.1 MAG: hypothetical protein CK430_03365 [Legionella sp.]
MALSFFRALNPVSDKSGIQYSLAHGNDCQGKEMLDASVWESIRNAFMKDLGYIEALQATFDILVGEHYDLTLKGKDNQKGGAKGILDFFILPLVARKLIADTLLKERDNSDFVNALAWLIAIPIEMVRFGAGIVLTLLLAPVVAIVHSLRACGDALIEAGTYKGLGGSGFRYDELEGAEIVRLSSF